MILLSSFGLRSPIVAEKVREYINPVGMKVLIIPFAGFSDKITASKEMNEGLIPFGFVPENIFVLDEHNLELCMENKFDMVYVPGGNPFKLLSQAQKCKINQWIVNMVKEGTTYFGVSSGADFVCEDIEYLKLVEECDFEVENYRGLGLIKEKVLCHVDQRDMGTIRRVKEYDDRDVIFLRNDEVYVIQ